MNKIAKIFVGSLLGLITLAGVGVLSLYLACEYILPFLVSLE